MNVTPDQESAFKTRAVWNLFSRFEEKELDHLLGSAGVVPRKIKPHKLHQVLSVWFQGRIPSDDEVYRLVSHFA